MSVATINSKIALAVSAQEAGDYTTALTYLRSAQMLLSVTPDSAGPASAGLTFDRAAIDRMITTLTMAKNASIAASGGGVRRTKINYVNPNDCD